MQNNCLRRRVQFCTPLTFLSKSDKLLKMVRFSLIIKTEIILTYGECRTDLDETIRTLIERYPDDEFTKFKVQRIINLFEDTGSVQDLKRVKKTRC